MNPIFITVVLFSLIFIANVCNAESLCNNTENVLFNCSIQNGKKLISVCSSKKLTKEVGYLQYRFGTKVKIELEYPSTTKDTQTKFYWRYMSGTEGSGGDLSFKNHEYLYTVGRADSNEVTNKISGVSSGTVTVSTMVGARIQRHLKCDSAPEGDFYSLLTGIVNDEEDLIESK